MARPKCKRLLVATGAMALVGSALLAAVKLGGRPVQRPSLPFPSRAKEEARRTAGRRLHLTTIVVALGVMLDSGIDHFRGGFYNPAMYLAPLVSALAGAASLLALRCPTCLSRLRRWVFLMAALIGLVGNGFHIYNVTRREGGWSLLNLFYGAPLGAPLGVSIVGIFGLIAEWLQSASKQRKPLRFLRLSLSKWLMAMSAIGMIGTAGEAGLLHFRGAFHDPFMFLPVTLPPLNGAVLGWTILRPAAWRRKLSRWLLYATAAVSLLGMGLHIIGVGRNMGGWRNWSQNVQVGPPIPAPLAFTGAALAGLIGLSLEEDSNA